MADKKSCGDIKTAEEILEKATSEFDALVAAAKNLGKEEITTLECMECKYREVFTKRQFKYTDGLSCDMCKGPVFPTITKPGEEIRNRRIKNEKGMI